MIIRETGCSQKMLKSLIVFVLASSGEFLILPTDQMFPKLDSSWILLIFLPPSVNDFVTVICVWYVTASVAPE